MELEGQTLGEFEFPLIPRQDLDGELKWKKKKSTFIEVR